MHTFSQSHNCFDYFVALLQTVKKTTLLIVSSCSDQKRWKSGKVKNVLMSSILCVLWWLLFMQPHIFHFLLQLSVLWFDKN